MLGGEERTNYPLTLVGGRSGGGVRADGAGAARRSEPSGCARCMHTALEALVEALETGAGDARCAGSRCCRRRSGEQVLEEWNATEAEYPQEQCVHELFEEQVERTPEAVAVVFEDEHAELRRAERAGEPAGALPAGAGRGAGRRGWRSAWSAVAGDGGRRCWRMLKAGGAYVPLDPSYPAERLRYMLEDSAAGGAADAGTVWRERAAGVGGARRWSIWTTSGRGDCGRQRGERPGDRGWD